MPGTKYERKCMLCEGMEATRKNPFIYLMRDTLLKRELVVAHKRCAQREGYILKKGHQIWTLDH